jgi:S1-C subfamily serine protease
MIDFRLRRGCPSVGEEPYHVSDDLIDFSDRDGEFLCSDIKQQALSFATITAVIGFVLSFWLFFNRQVGPAADLLDRRAAEGRVVVQKRAGRADASDSGFSFRAPRVKAYEPKEKQRERPAWKELRAAAAAVKANRKNSKDVNRKVADTSLGVVPEYSRTTKAGPKSSPKVSQRAAPKSQPVDLDRLLFPIIETRPDRDSLIAVEESVRQNVFVLESPRGDTRLGVVLDSSGRALVSSSVAQAAYLHRIWSNGSWHQASVLAVDDEFGLALIQIRGGNFKDMPLAPVPPFEGERLVSFIARGRAPAGLTGRTGISFGRAGYFVEGDFSGSSVGAPLFNERGEIAGCQVYTLAGAPGSGLHLATDTAAIYRLLRGYRGSAIGLSATEADAKSRLTSFLENVAQLGEAKRGRVLPGIGLSDFHLGMTESEVKKWVSTPKIQRFGDGLVTWQSPAPPVTLYFVNGRLALAATRHLGFSTSDGLSVGAEAQVRELSKDHGELEAYPGMLSLSGLEILLDSGGRVKEFVVRPALSSP